MDIIYTKKPCRHHISGKCLRKDCTFEHNFSDFTCSFWLLSQCAQQEPCIFLHDFSKELTNIFGVDEENVQLSEYQIQPEDYALFPPLPSPTMSVPTQASSSSLSASDIQAELKKITFGVRVSNNRNHSSTPEVFSMSQQQAAKRILEVPQACDYVQTGHTVGNAYKVLRAQVGC